VQAEVILDLFRHPLPNRIVNILGTLCVNANAGNHFCYRYENKYQWYRIKDMLLARYGTLVGEDIQRIKRECHSCDATGYWHYWYDDGGDICDRCWGTGVWQWEFNFLNRYELFGKTFHRPHGTRILTDDGKKFEPTIKGKMKHIEVSARKAWWSFVILALLFNPREIKIVFGHWRHYTLNQWRISQTVRTILAKLRWSVEKREWMGKN
jgi:hypothetical protein